MSDLIDRRDAIDALEQMQKDISGDYTELDPLVMAGCGYIGDCIGVLEALPSAITDEQAILHLQSTGWMQNHDREMYESGLKKRLADDSGDYGSLIPCEDTISRQQAITALRALSDEDGYINAPHEVVTDVVRGLPPVKVKQGRTVHSEQPKKDKFGVKTSETCEDCISRQAAIDMLKNRWKKTRNYEGIGDDIAEECELYLKQVPSAQPETNCSEIPNNSDTISRQAAIDAIAPTIKSILQGNSFKAINVIDKIRNLPPAQPERKRGKWTKENACEFCGFQPWFERDIHTLSFCPNCGADMREGQDG